MNNSQLDSLIPTSSQACDLKSSDAEPFKAAESLPDGSVTPANEALTPSSKSIQRSLCYPVSSFQGDVDSTIALRLIWDTDGSVKMADSLGRTFAFRLPTVNGTFTLLQNNTTIDQKFVGTDLQYDVYWKAVQNSNGDFDRFKFTIVGSSEQSRTLSILLSDDSDQKLVVQEDKIISTLDPRASTEPESAPIVKSASDKDAVIESDNEEVVIDAGQGDTNVDSNGGSLSQDVKDQDSASGGLGVDWSDAVSSGNQVSFDLARGSIDLKVGKSFNIDPTTVSSIAVTLSPPSTDYYEGEKRVVSVGTNLFAFYYDGSNIVYKYSIDNGITWSSTATSTGTGVLTNEYYRYTVATTKVGTTNYIDLLYYTQSGSNTNFFAKAFSVSGTTLTLLATTTLFTVANDASCSPTGVCSASTAATDSSGVLYAGFSYKTGGTFYKQILKSSNGGQTWSTSMSPRTKTTTGSHLPISLMSLGSNHMLLAVARYDYSNLSYNYFNGTAWGDAVTISGIGWSANTVKQISSATDPVTNEGYVAFITGGNSGSLRIIKFSTDTSFSLMQSVDTGISHALPSLVSTASDGVVRIYSIANGKLYETKKGPVGWQAPFNPYNTCAPDQLTAGASYAAGLLREGSSSPFAIRFASALTFGTICIGTSTVTQSPPASDYYEGEKRIANIAGTLFAFSYDGSNIVYQSSTDDGRTWSSATSTSTGALTNEYYRYTVGTATVGTANYVVLFYFTQSGSNTNFYAKAFTVSGTTLILLATNTLFTVANDASCSPTGTCSAASAAADTNGNLFTVFSYKTGGTFNIRVSKSTDGGQTWSTSMNPRSVTTTGPRLPITLTNLASNKMIIAYAKYESSSMFYNVFNGTTWGNGVTVSGIGWSSNTIKHISSASNSTGFAFVPYVTSGLSGSLKVAKFSNTGTFLASETADSTLSHALPSITFMPNVSTSSTIYIYTLSGGKIYETKKAGGTWNTPSNPFGTIFISPDQLTTATNDPSLMWKEGSASPYGRMFGRDAFAVADDYQNLVNQLDSTGQSLSTTTITTQLVASINSTLNRLKTDVIALQNLGYDGELITQRVSTKMVGTVRFYNIASGSTLFSKQIPDGTLGIFAIMGLTEQYAQQGVAIDFASLSDILKTSVSVANTIASYSDDSIATNFVAASVGAYHPSTGHTFIITIIILIPIAIQACIEIPACDVALQTAADWLLNKGWQFAFPAIQISGQKFNDLNGDGIKQTNEGWRANWNFKLRADAFGVLTWEVARTTSDSNGLFSWGYDRILMVPRYVEHLQIIEEPQTGWKATTPTHGILTISINPPGFPPVDPNPNEISYFTSTGYLFGNQQIASNSVDVFFDIDTTGSFSYFESSFKSEATNIMNQIRSAIPDSQFGVGSFADYPFYAYGGPADYAYHRDTAITSNILTVQTAADNIPYNWGDDDPEADLPSLYQAATGAGQDLNGNGNYNDLGDITPNQQAGFRAGSIKIIVIFTDNPFHSEQDYFGPSFATTIDALNAQNIKVIGMGTILGLEHERIVATGTGTLAPPGGIDCDSDSVIDIVAGQPVVCEINNSTDMVSAIVATVRAVSGH